MNSCNMSALRDPAPHPMSYGIYGDSALTRAANFGNQEVVEISLSAGANTASNVNYQAFATAILNRDLQVARELPVSIIALRRTFTS